MPRVADIYSRPAGIDGIPNQTIESADYNLNVADVEADLNLPRPIVAGGTGASNATTARDNLDAERAMATVTNYDTQVWENGSFWSAAGATSPPVAGRTLTGTCIIADNNPSYIDLEVRTLDAILPVLTYRRQKIAGSWGAWKQVGTITSGGADYITGEAADMCFGLAGTAPNSFFFVNSESDTSGVNTFAVTKAGTVALNSAPAVEMDLIFRPAGTTRWFMRASNDSNFYIYRYNASGVLVDTPLSINGADGRVYLANDLSVNKANAQIVLTKPSGGSSSVVSGYVGTAPRWLVHLGDNSPEAGGNQGSNFVIAAFGDGGAFISNPFMIDRALGITKINSDLASPGSHASLKISYDNTRSAVTTRGTLDGIATVVFENVAGAVVGTIVQAAASTAYNTTSDERLKEDLKSFDAGNIIDDTNVYNFAWKGTGERAYGVVAQQAIDVYPTAITHLKDQDWYGVDYSKYVPVILQELKALRARVAEIEGKLAAGAQPA